MAMARLKGSLFYAKAFTGHLQAMYYAGKAQRLG
jgi:hypothetical protein